MLERRGEDKEIQGQKQGGKKRESGGGGGRGWHQQYVNRERPDVQAGFAKGRGTRD